MQRQAEEERLYCKEKGRLNCSPSPGHLAPSVATAPLSEPVSPPAPVSVQSSGCSIGKGMDALGVPT